MMGAYAQAEIVVGGISAIRASKVPAKRAFSLELGMNEKQQERAQSNWMTAPVRCGPWTLIRVEIISTVRPKKWPVARIELLHETRGHTFRIATGAGAMDAALNAVADAIGRDAELIELRASFGQSCDVVAAAVHVRVRIDELEYNGQADCGDLVVSTVAAFLKAVCSAGGGICRPQTASTVQISAAPTTRSSNFAA